MWQHVCNIKLNSWWTENIITLCYLSQRNPDAVVFPQLDQLLHEAGSVTFTAHMNAGCQ